MSTEKWKCFVCKKSLKSPVVANCGHVYCWRCLTQHRNEGKETCPKCGENLKESEFIPIFCLSTDDKLNELPALPRVKTMGTNNKTTTNNNTNAGSANNTNHANTAPRNNFNGPNIHNDAANRNPNERNRRRNANFVFRFDGFGIPLERDFIHIIFVVLAIIFLPETL